MMSATRLLAILWYPICVTLEIGGNSSTTDIDRMLPAVTAPPQNCALHEDGYSDASRRGRYLRR